MTTFVAVNDDVLKDRIAAAASRLVFVAPAVSIAIATALGTCFARADQVSITLVLDPDEEAYRLGYGDREGLEKLRELADQHHIPLRAQTGLRIGLLVVDDNVLIWSPTPIAVEEKRIETEPNGLEFGSEPIASGDPNSIVDIVCNAVGSDDSNVLLESAELGRKPFTLEAAAKTIEILKQNPPAPFNLARKTRVFSTKFQFVEPEVRGAAWTTREVRLSSLLLNPDVPEELQDLFETKVRPFSTHANLAIEVPTVVQGQIAYTRTGEKIVSPMRQADIEKLWKEILKRYLRRIEGFGWLIDRTEKAKLEAEVASYDVVLKVWVAGFRQVAANDESALIKNIVDLIKARAARSAAKDSMKDIDIESTVRSGIQRLRVTEPKVKLVFKDISWESTRDAEFTEALRKALPSEALKGWFEEFTAARERSS